MSSGSPKRPAGIRALITGSVKAGLGRALK
jgi:hypothetical protein